MTTISLAEAFVDSDREYWHGVLTGGGFTPIPRWTLDPVPGVAACEALVPGDLLPALRKRAAELGVPLSSVLAPDSFLMKGEEIPPHARWGGNPAREM